MYRTACCKRMGSGTCTERQGWMKQSDGSMQLDKPEGVILNLDADCTVEKNYFVAVCDELLKRKTDQHVQYILNILFQAMIIRRIFYKYITLYELHLRYYFQGLAYSGFPYVFHTVGSAIAVKALPYIKAGGMNRSRQEKIFILFRNWFLPEDIST